MKVTGYMLREEIRKTNLQISMLEAEFQESKSAFRDEKKRTLEEISASLMKAERKVCFLQEATQKYNLSVNAEVPKVGKLTLAQTIKLIGPISRLEKKWRDLAAPNKGVNRYYEAGNVTVRDKEKEYANPTFTREQAGVQARETGVQLASLRSALGMMNAKEIDLDIHPSLFE